MSPENISAVTSTLWQEKPIFVKYCGNRGRNNNSSKLLNHYSYHCYYCSLLWISFAVTPVMGLAIFWHFSAFSLFYRVHNPRTDVRAENINQQFMDNTFIIRKLPYSNRITFLGGFIWEAQNRWAQDDWTGCRVWTMVWWPRAQMECGAMKCRAWSRCLEASHGWDMIVSAWNGPQSLES